MMPGAHQASICKIPYDLLPIEDRIGLIQSDIEEGCRSNLGVTLA
jgi:hypothetical protein